MGFLYLFTLAATPVWIMFFFWCAHARHHDPVSDFGWEIVRLLREFDVSIYYFDEGKTFWIAFGSYTFTAGLLIFIALVEPRFKSWLFKPMREWGAARVVSLYTLAGVFSAGVVGLLLLTVGAEIADDGLSRFMNNLRVSIMSGAGGLFAVVGGLAAALFLRGVPDMWRGSDGTALGSAAAGGAIGGGIGFLAGNTKRGAGIGIGVGLLIHFLRAIFSPAIMFIIPAAGIGYVVGMLIGGVLFIALFLLSPFLPGALAYLLTLPVMLVGLLIKPHK